mmetsp:Transcript_2134/g.8092  ORF Transcript_2134/g.8092 Transcript_2134/m.8092 type:complete len:228 (-) Transcript_2134:1106-1789(-)
MAGAQGRVRGRHARRRWKFSPRSAVRGARGRVLEARGAARAVARARRAAGVQAHGGIIVGERRGRWEISEEAAEGRRGRCGRASSERRRDAREGVRCSRNAARAPTARQAGRDAVPSRHARAVLAALRSSPDGGIIGRRRRRRGRDGWRRRRGSEPRARAARRALVRASSTRARNRSGGQRRARPVRARARRRRQPCRPPRRRARELRRPRALGLLPRAAPAPTPRP